MFNQNYQPEQLLGDLFLHNVYELLEGTLIRTGKYQSLEIETHKGENDAFRIVATIDTTIPGIDNQELSLDNIKANSFMNTLYELLEGTLAAVGKFKSLGLHISKQDGDIHRIVVSIETFLPSPVNPELQQALASLTVLPLGSKYAHKA